MNDPMNWIMLAAVVFGPLAAVAITLWYEDRRAKRDAKTRLFLDMMAHRQSHPPSAQWVSALNQLDVVFYDESEVKNAWRVYYDALSGPRDSRNMSRFRHCELDLLQAMASALGYPKIKQTDMDRFYTPTAWGDIGDIQSEIQDEWLRVLRNTSALVAVPRSLEEDSAEGPPETSESPTQPA